MASPGADGIRIGFTVDELTRAPLQRRAALLRRAADAGIDHAFFADHVSFHVGAGMDGLLLASIAAALEPRLEVMVGVYLLALRHPVPVARQIATLCEAAPGRLRFGVGVGGEDRHEIEICGVDPKTRGRRTDESLIALRGLLSGEKTRHACEFFGFDDAWIRPAPDPPVPILVGGRAPAALRRAALHGDGWLGVWCSPERFATNVAAIATQAREAGRDPSGFRHGLQLWAASGTDRSATRERLAQAMQGFYRVPFEKFERYSPHGGVEEVADALHAQVGAGCRSFNVMMVADEAERAIDDLAEVARRLREGLP